MKIALFDQINETHVCMALEDALKDLGHEVVATGAVWQGHRTASAAEDLERIDRALDRMIDAGCEALLNFRAASLSAVQLARLREAGVASAVWLPDDPVLYGITYGAIVDGYDYVLHCGAEPVLAFYDRRGHRPGVAFPFWLDPERWRSAWSAERANNSILFLGNLHGPAKQGRYSQFASAGRRRLALYGKCPDDPAGMHRGQLYGVDAILAIAPKFIAGLNLPQRFSDYAGSPYNFPGLSRLGTFDLPSRVLQYAAMGLPVISMGKDANSRQFGHDLQAADIEEALAIAAWLHDDPGEAEALSGLGRYEVATHFSGRARAMLLVALFQRRIEPAGLTLTQRAHLYRNFQEYPADGA
jgi:hypothetical protein